MNSQLMRALATRRELPEALAHYFVATKPGEPRLAAAARIYAHLNAADQLRTRAEISACRQARRGEVEAELVA
jgi:uncharacterized tellurite resistance protein B-like protein